MGDRDMDAIENEIEQARERLASTIDQLVYRTSPRTIVRREAAQVRSLFVTEEGAVRTDTVIKVAVGVAGTVVVFVVLRKLFR